MVARGEVWLVALDPTIEREIQKTRPCLVVSPPELNNHLRTVLVAPLTTGSHPAPFRAQVRFGGKSGLILLEQLRAIDTTRLAKRLGAVDDKALAQSLSILQAMFAP